MRFVFHPHDGQEAVGYRPPILDLHGRPMVTASLVPANHPGCARVFEPGVPFDVDENDHKRGGYWLAHFCRAHSDFQVLNRAAPPKRFEEERPIAAETEEQT
jgi:hypothetical protein